MVSAPSVTQQCLRLGLLDAIRLDLVPVVLGVPGVSGGVAFANRSAGRGRGGVDLRGELAAPALVQDIAALHPCEPGPADSQDSGPP